jgi:hypothetical protein
VKVVLEVGAKKAFATALDWPGWCRSGRTPDAALNALLDYGRRYGAVLADSGLGFVPPADLTALRVVAELPGDATTDFGAPGQQAPGDSDPASAEELERWLTILDVCWAAFDRVVEQAQGVALRKGPRGGGRELEAIVEHLGMSDAGYLSSLGGRWKPDPADSAGQTASLRAAIQATLAASVRVEIAAQGPRGGLRWPPRYFVRRFAWHTLDHAWEIEDRAR